MGIAAGVSRAFSHDAMHAGQAGQAGVGIKSAPMCMSAQAGVGIKSAPTLSDCAHGRTEKATLGGLSAVWKEKHWLTKAYDIRLRKSWRMEKATFRWPRQRPPSGSDVHRS